MGQAWHCDTKVYRDLCIYIWTILGGVHIYKSQWFVFLFSAIILKYDKIIDNTDNDITQRW